MQFVYIKMNLRSFYQNKSKKITNKISFITHFTPHSMKVFEKGVV